MTLGRFSPETPVFPAKTPLSRDLIQDICFAYVKGSTVKSHNFVVKKVELDLRKRYI